MDNNNNNKMFKMILRSRKKKEQSESKESESIKKEDKSESEYEEYSDNNSDSDYEESISIKKEQSSTRKRKNVENNDDKYIKEYTKLSESYSNETPLSIIEVRHRLFQEIIPSKKRLLMCYFKTGPGEYADGDQFLGVPVPGIRSTIKYCNSLDFEEIFWLLTSSYHEERMLASFYLVELSKKLVKEENKRKKDKNQYLLILNNINNTLKKYKCNTIPELVNYFVSKPGCKPGERQGWDVSAIFSADNRQKEKYERIGESRPVLLDEGYTIKNKSNLLYEYKSYLGFTDSLKIQKQILFEFYVECMPWIDNWDLVDLTCRDIIGNFLSELDDQHIKTILYNWVTYKINDQVAGYTRLQNKLKKGVIKKEESSSFSFIDNLSLTTIWTKRVAIICTFYFINKLEFKYTIFLLETLLDFSNEEIHGPKSQNSISGKNKFHDLIEKASGWMLREIGKRDGSCTGKGCKCILKDDKIEKENNNAITTSFDIYANKKKTLIHFLNKYAWKMPRTMLRYSIEKLSTSEKSKYLNATEPFE
ncbi:hypothetical protein BCR36DRAFT_402785 [Piromyces finnis]|uniref:Uncharacterized protein n=1 Tax=Piromyces finnis TaxID=1754191 RepID=A0A1Y1VH79_9FUNG|nr:hypothetical protein BCR36DRAFT_402785 [Piromyces finnis]|eukprot:ORX56010.1 hypothetical protein BCR36DRAFT_402785 [Piromyces finnis]